MFFTGDDEDQEFVNPGGGSKLSSLFSLDQKTNVGGNSSLTYTAPKQPKKKGAAPEGGGGAPTILVAAVVHAYKYVDGQYVPQGKLGSALLGNSAVKDYRILLYISKDKQVTNSKITASTIFTLQANNYASFYDDARTSWSVMFDTEENAVKFAKQVCLAKTDCAGGGLDSVVSQDLVVGEGRSLESGDAAEVRYTGWLLQNNSYGQMFDSNVNSDKLFRLKLGKGKVIKGWDMGLVGMKKGGKRMLVIPPSLGYGTQGMGDRIPANSTLIFETELVRAKFQRGEQSPDPSPSPAMVPPVNHTTDNLPELDQTIKGRTKSITEHMAQSGDTGKAKLISRMAKMGKPMLPMAGGAPAIPSSDDEDAEVEEHYQPALEERPPGIQKPQPQMPGHTQPTPTFQQPQMFTQSPAVQSHTPVSFQQYSPNQGGNQMAAFNQTQNYLQQQQQLQQLQQQQQQQQQMQQQLQQQSMQSLQTQSFQAPGYQMTPSNMMTQNPYSGSSSTPPSGQSLDVFGPVLLTETRQQNTEVRMAISKIGDKVDKVYERISDLHSLGGSSMSQGVTAPNMEVSILVQNVTRIAQENDNLKKDVFEKSAKIENQNEKIAELLHKNQRFVEQSNTLLEERNEGYQHTATQSQAKVLELEQQKVTLAGDLSAASSQLSAIQLELATSRKNEAELMQRIQSTKDTSYQSAEERERLRFQHEEDEKKISELTGSLREEKQHRKNLESSNSQLQEEFSDLKSSKENLERSIADRRRKITAERKKLEEEMEEMKSNLEQEIQTLHDKLRRQKVSTDEATSDKMSRIELEIDEQWQKKCDKLVAAANDKHARSVQDVNEEIDDLSYKLKEAEHRIVTLKSTYSSNDEKINELEEEIEELQVWKDKYDNLRTQATSMKEKYEERIREIEEENDMQVEELEEKIEELEETVKNTPTSAGVILSGDMVNEVKKIMNNVYQDLREEFDSDEEYLGSEVLSSLLNSIKTTTLQLVNSQKEKTTEEVVERVDKEEEEKEEINSKVGVEKTKEETVKTDEISKIDTPKTETELKKEEYVKHEKTAVVEETMTADDVIVVESAPKTTAAKTPITPSKISCKTDHLTGDKGNRIYSDQLDKHNPVPVPITSEHGYITGDKGNRVYSDKLDQLHSTAPLVEETIGKVETKQVHSSPSKPPQVVEESFGKSEATSLEAGNKSSRTPVPVPITEEDNHITGDKGNRIYSEKLHQLESAPTSTSSLAGMVVEETVGKSQSSPVQSIPPAEPNTSPVVEEAIGKTESSSLEAGPPDSNHKPVKPAIIKPKADHPTGDKGNRIYSDKLDKHNPVPKPIEKKFDHITGDKGNKYHTEDLDKLKPVTESFGKTESSVSHAAPTTKDKIEADIKPATVHQVHAPKPKPIVPHLISNTAHITGDKGNRLYKEDLDKLDPLRKAVNESVNKDTELIVGDKGNPYHTAELDKLGSDKDKEVTTNKDSHSKDIDQSSSSKSKSITNDQSKILSQNSNDQTTNQTESKTRTSSLKSRSSSSGSVDNVPTLATKEPPPLFDEEEDSPLFGNDSTVADTLGTAYIKPSATTTNKTDSKKSTKTTKLPSKNDLVDEDDKQPPPPLFGDDNDDDELNWLS